MIGPLYADDLQIKKQRPTKWLLPVSDAQFKIVKKEWHHQLYLTNKLKTIKLKA